MRSAFVMMTIMRKNGACVQCEAGEILNASKDGCICDESNNYYLQDGACVLCDQDNRELVNGSCNCITGYEEETQADGSVICVKEAIVVTCDAPKELVDGECVCDSDSGYIANTNGNDCICDEGRNYYLQGDKCVLCDQDNRKLVNGACVCDSSEGYVAKGSGCVCDESNYYYDYMGSCIECKPPKKLVNGVCEEEAKAASSNVQPKKADNCADGCLKWSEWGEWSIPSGGASCPSDKAFDPPSADTDKERTRSRDCPNLETGVECFTTNTETKRCKWCQGMGQIFDDDGDCVCDVSRSFYKDSSTTLPTCKICASVKTPNAIGDGCICKDDKCEANEKKEWDSVNCKCGECKPDEVATCSYGHDKNTCDCKPEPMIAPEPEPEPPVTITLTLYSGCYTWSNTSALYLPILAGDLGSNHKWKLECFSSGPYTYEDASYILSNPDSTSAAVTPIIQKLYDCANNQNGDISGTQRKKSDFIDKLTNNDGLCPQSNNNTYTVTITP